MRVIANLSAGATAFAYMIGIYAIMFGVLLLALAYELRNFVDMRAEHILGTAPQVSFSRSAHVRAVPKREEPQRKCAAAPHTTRRDCHARAHEAAGAPLKWSFASLRICLSRAAVRRSSYWSFSILACSARQRGGKLRQHDQVHQHHDEHEFGK